MLQSKDHFLFFIEVIKYIKNLYIKKYHNYNYGSIGSNYLISTSFDSKTNILELTNYLKTNKLSCDLFFYNIMDFLKKYIATYNNTIDINFRDIKGSNIIMILCNYYGFCYDDTSMKKNILYIEVLTFFFSKFKENIIYDNTLINIIINNKYFNILNLDNTLYNIINTTILENRVIFNLCKKEIDYYNDNMYQNYYIYSNYYNLIKMNLFNKKDLDINILYSNEGTNTLYENIFSMCLLSNKLFSLMYTYELKNINFKYIYLLNPYMIIKRSLNLNIFNYHNFLKLLKYDNFDINLRVNNKTFLIMMIECLNEQYDNIQDGENFETEKLKLLLYMFKSTINIYESDLNIFDYIEYPDILEYVIDPDLEEIDNALDTLGVY